MKKPMKMKKATPAKMGHKKSAAKMGHKKSPAKKAIPADAKGLSKMAKSERGKEAVKGMGFTKTADGTMLMKAKASMAKLKKSMAKLKKEEKTAMMMKKKGSAMMMKAKKSMATMKKKMAAATKMMKKK